MKVFDLFFLIQDFVKARYVDPDVYCSFFRKKKTQKIVFILSNPKDYDYYFDNENYEGLLECVEKNLDRKITF